MQNASGRYTLGIGSTFNSLNANNFRERPMLDASTTFCTRKDFWVDPKKVKIAATEKAVKDFAGKTGAKNKKNLTFNQLLQKHGYI